MKDDTKDKNVSVIDPDHVPELFCAGRFGVSVGPISELLFTHARPKAGSLLNDGTADFEAVVRARLLLPLSNLVALRDVLNKLLQEHPSEMASSTSSRPLN